MKALDASLAALAALVFLAGEVVAYLEFLAGADEVQALLFSCVEVPGAVVGGAEEVEALAFLALAALGGGGAGAKEAGAGDSLGGLTALGGGGAAGAEEAGADGDLAALGGGAADEDPW